MTEAEIIEQLVEIMNVLMMSVSVYFTIVSAYIVALWAFLSRASVMLKLFSFGFFTAALAFLVSFFMGVNALHEGLISALNQISQTSGLGPAGQAALMNTGTGIDAQIEMVMWAVGVGFYIAAFFLTFFSRSTLNADQSG